MIDITFINHATSLIRINSIYILTDPVWSNWLGIPIFGVRRVNKAGIKIEEIKRVDIVLISHNHFDHLDIPTLKILQNKFNPIFITGLGNKELLTKNGLLNVIELNWWEQTSLENINIHFVPSQHWSGRMPWDIDTTLWGGFIIETKYGCIYFMGDGAYNEIYFNEIKNKFSNIKVSLLPVSPSEERFRIQHMNSYDALKAHNILKSNICIGIHFGTFFNHRNENIPKQIKILKHGETLSIT